MRLPRLLAAAVILLLLQALAEPQQARTLDIVQAWSRATPPGSPIGVAYFDIVNAGEADVLLRASSPIARVAEMHENSMEGGTMQMRPLERVAIPARSRVRFEPSGKHIMLIDLKRPLKQGEKFTVSLVFQRAGTRNAEVLVAPLGAAEAPAHH